MQKFNDRKIQDEVEGMIDQISKPSIDPSPEFANKLEGQILSALDSNSSYFNSFLHPMKIVKNKALLLAVGAAAFGVPLVAGITFLALNRGSLDPANKSAEEIFAAMADSKSSSSLLHSADKSADQKLSSESTLIAPVRVNKQYEYFKTEVTSGPKASVCGYYRPLGLDKSITEYYSYYEEKSGNFSKSTIQNESGKVYSYYLSDGEFNYEYLGGDFAVKTPYVDYFTLLEGREEIASSEVAVDDTNTSSEVPADPSTPEVKPDINTMFGPEAKVLGQEEIDGKTYYVVTWSYENFCEENKTIKVYNKVWVDSVDFQYKKEEVYLNDIKSSNLIITSENTRVVEMKDPTSVLKDFKFDLGVGVREVDPSENAHGSDNYINAINTMLSAKNIKVLAPADSKYKLNSYSADRLNLPDPNAYRFERGFYSNDGIGEKMYTEAKVNYANNTENNAYLTNYFTKQEGEKYSNLSYGVYDIKSLDEMKKQLGYESSVTTVATTIILDGNSIEVQAVDLNSMYEQTKPSEEGQSSAPSAPDISACQDCTKSFAVFFDHNGKTYSLTIDGLTSIDEIKTFKLVTKSSASYIDEVKKLPKQSDVIAL